MKQNYNSQLFTLSSSLHILFLTGNSFVANNVAALCQNRIKTSNRNFLSAFLMVMALSFGQKAMAKNTPNYIFTSSKFIVNHILISSVTEGRGGGGGHGNDDWVIGHPLDVGQKDLLSGIINTNDHNTLYKI